MATFESRCLQLGTVDNMLNLCDIRSASQQLKTGWGGRLMQTYNLKNRILIPLSLALVILLTGFVVSFYQNQARHLNAEIIQKLESVEKLFAAQLDNDAQMMSAGLEIVLHDKQLQTALKNKDRGALLKQALPLFKLLRSNHRITHFYFTGPDRVNILRVHKPNKYGDKINRFTTLEVERSRKTSCGIELGPLGTFTLRVVAPWYEEDRLIGYVEFGEEIEHITQKLHDILKVELYVVIQKKFLTRKTWEAGMRMLGRKAAWDRFPAVVMIDRTAEVFPEDLIKFLNETHRTSMKTDIEISLNDRRYRTIFLQLKDAGDRGVGDMVIMFDVTDMASDFHTTIFHVGAICLAVGGILFVLFYIFLSQIERQIVKSSEALQESEEKYRLLLNNLPSVVYKGYKDWTVEFIDRKLELLTGYDVDEFNSKKMKWSDIIVKEDIENAKENFIQALKSDKLYAREYRIRSKDGDILWIQERGQIICDKKGKIEYISGVFFDVTDRKQAEQELRVSEEQLEAIFSSVHTGLIIIDGESHTIIDANPYAVSLIGVSADKIAGKVCHEFICPAEKGKCPITDLGQTVDKSERVLLSIDGEKIPILKSVTIVNIDGKECFVESFVDISDLKKAEEEKKRLEAQLQQAQKLKSVGILAGGIAHDFNNLLSIIMGNISLVENDIKPEVGVSEYLKEAKKASLLARDLTKQLITFSKGGAPVKQLSYISNLIEKATDFALSGSMVGCEFNMPDDLWPVEIDEGQIRHVVNNVVINAVQAMPKGGTIEICAENVVSGTDIDYEGVLLQDGKYVKISFRDQGVGISDKDLPVVFDPYYSSKERGTKKGMGLGLATSYSIIKKHNGEITVESKVGVGTTINIYLPASKIEVPVKKKLEEKEIIGKGRILVMDDEEMVRNMIGQMLNRLGYKVEFSKDGAEAIESYRKAIKSDEPFDAVMLDLTVRGGMGGKDAIQKLIEIDPGVKGIVSSGHSEDPVMADCEKYTFCAAVAKPFSMPELSVVLDKVITDGESADVS